MVHKVIRSLYRIPLFTLDIFQSDSPEITQSEQPDFVFELAG